ncbi:hypothetical protein EXIGLDRAFT_764228 [Exidia glandulosa HHB12029]|uniref:F-box domain-containing protein n=1 Tax=Exidia glandulosa HHB12029 TaxID=1314781 RepID=A0A165LDJ3_EXIGL|nr:hypothetical protein EXIGLDRAFT_764228 [Exidia glandulosa HHB12029]
MPLAKLDSITAAEARRLNAQLKFLGSPRVQLSVLLNTSNNTFFPSATFVRKHLSRAVELDVIVHGNSPTHTESDIFLKLLSTATPLLHTLSVSFDCSSKLESFLISSPWFGGSAPSLRRCRFYKAAFYAPVFSFVRVVFFLVDDNSRLEHLNAVLYQFPQLEELCIRCHNPLDRSRSRLKSPPGLMCLWLEGRVARLLKYLDSRAVPSVIIRQTVTPELTRMRHLVREPVKILDIIPYEDQPDLVFRSLLVRITESPQRSRVLEIEIPIADELVNDLLFSHLTTLSLHDPHRLRDVELPSMPALTHLAVYVAGPLAALHDALQPWALPRLRRLELVFTCAPGTNHRDCPAADITKFITLNLQAKSRSVGLVIRGAKVIEPSVAELSAHVASLDVEFHVRVPNAAPVWVRAADFENVWNGEVTLRDAM